MMERITNNEGQPERKDFEAFVPMRRYAVPQEIANAVLWLCSARHRTYRHDHARRRRRRRVLELRPASGRASAHTCTSTSKPERSINSRVRSKFHPAVVR